MSARDESAELEAGPALPWAHAMSDDDLHGFLDDLVSAAMGRWRSDPDVPDRQVLADIEKACAGWRTPGQGFRSDEPEPGPSVEESADRLTRFFAPSQALREEPHDSPLHHDYRVPRDLPEPAHPVPCRFPKSPGCTCRLTGADVEAAGGGSC